MRAPFPLDLAANGITSLTMAVPALQINNLTPIVPGADHHIAATRKSLHQNIFGKLRPLPFQYHWTIWYDKNVTNPTTSTTTNQLYILHQDVADIGTFYRVYNNYPWEKVRARDSVHIFRQGVQPSPKDPENRNGGCWRFRVPKAKAQAFFHELAILCMANELQAALETGMFVVPVIPFVYMYIYIYIYIYIWLVLTWCLQNMTTSSGSHRRFSSIHI